MNDKTLELLNRLADKFGTTAEHLWGVLVKQAYIGAWAYIITGAVILMASGLVITLTAKTVKADFNADTPSASSAAFFGACMALLFCIVGGVATAPEIITRFLNPEYWALKQVLP